MEKNMKKMTNITRFIAFAMVLMMLVGVLSGCDFLPDNIKTCTVSFYVDGELFTTKTVSIGSTVSSPRAPEKENQVFVGWFAEGILTYEHDFSSKILVDTSLHAHYTLDAVSLTNKITTTTMRSVVVVKNKSYNTGLGGLVEIDFSISQGSGVVLDISGGYCYVLTNYHVIEMDEGYARQTLTVEDPWGEQYEAKVYRSSKTQKYAMDAKYDLALIYFPYTPTGDYQLLEIETGVDPSPKSYVVSLGAPTGQKNSVTYGSVIEYRKLNYTEENKNDEVEFDIIYHSAIIDHGSSGGPLLDSTGKLVGLNFAGYETTKHGCAIPISKITEFMNKYVYAK